MQGRWSKLLLHIIVVFLLVFTLLFFMLKNKGKIAEATSPIAGFVAQVDQVISAPFRAFDDLSTRVNNLLSTYEENEELKQSLATLEDQQERVASLEAENASLRSVLDLEKRVANPLKLRGEVIVRTSTAWLDELVVNIGQAKGVQKGMFALANGGLIGKVVEVSQNSSRISLLTNQGNKPEIPVKWTQGDKTFYGILSAYDFQKKMFLVSEINTDEELSDKSDVLTSGLDGESVENLTIGQINDIDNANRQLFVQPSADFSKISFVTLVGK